LFAAPSLLLLLLVQTSSPATEYSKGKMAFDRGEYAKAIELLRPLIYPEPRLESEGLIVTAHHMLGVAHLFEHQNDQAAQEFRKLLQLRPEFRMDSRIDPPLVVDFFNGVLKQYESELGELSRMRQQAEADERRRQDAFRNGPRVIERRFARNSLAVAFLPFGAGQFQNGHRTKGWVFLGSQAFLAGVSVAAFTTNFAVHGFRPVIECEPVPGDTSARNPGCAPGYRPTSAQDRSKLLLRVQLVSGALFFAAAIWGVTDAILNFQPEVEVLPNGAPAARATPPRASRSGPRLVFTPLGEGSWAGALAFRF
jgi:hypothetical protein